LWRLFAGSDKPLLGRLRACGSHTTRESCGICRATALPRRLAGTGEPAQYLGSNNKAAAAERAVMAQLRLALGTRDYFDNDEPRRAAE
jgi:hypothetical protein